MMERDRPPGEGFEPPTGPPVPLAPSSVEPPDLGQLSGRRPAFAVDLRGGWGTAVVGAVVVASVLGIVAEGLSFLFYAATSGSNGSRPDFARIGGVIFYAFHRVGLVFEVPRSVSGELGQSGLGLPLSARFTASIAIMGGTILAMALLYLAGRAVADRAGGDAWTRGVHGAKVGVPYAIVCLVVAWAVRFSFPLGGGSLAIHPSYAAAGLWPLGLGVVFGFVGGIRSGGDARWTAPAWTDAAMVGRVRAAVAGGWSMIALGLILSFVGLLVLAAVKPDATRDYFTGAFRGGADAGTATIAANVLVVPNMAAWVLFPSMGSCVGASGGSFGLQGSFCVLSYTQFPKAGAVGGFIGGGGIGALPNPPPGYYAFVLVPLVAVLAGGMVAARRASAETRGEAVAVGVLAGVTFALMAILVLVLSIVSVRVGGQVGGVSQAVTIRLGPELAKSVLLAFAWGIVGGGIGGFIQGRALPAGSTGRARPFELPGER
jgi:hypothetical protein